jgi:hypothetical protein
MLYERLEDERLLTGTVVRAKSSLCGGMEVQLRSLGSQSTVYNCHKDFRKGGCNRNAAIVFGV